MRSKRTSFPLLGLLLVAGLIYQTSFVTFAQRALIKPPPPKTRLDNVTETRHAVTIADPYGWLEDQDSPETRAWIDEQNRYTQSVIGSLPGRDAIHKRLEQLLKIDVIGIPTARGDRYFFSKRLATQNQSVIYMRQGLKGKDEVLIDPNKMSADQTTSAGIVDVSDDGKWLIYSVRQGGKDETVIRLMDLDSRKDLPDQMTEARYSGFQMLPDKSGIYYSKAIYPEGEKRTVSRVYYHVMGTPQADDKMIFGEGYGFTDTVAPDVSLDGAGQSVGLIEFDSYYPSDITAYQSLAGLPAFTVTNVFLNGATGKPGRDNIEAALDIAMVTSMAPGGCCSRSIPQM